MDQKQSAYSRRQALRAGAVLAGAAWVSPALVVIGADAAHADPASGGTPPTVLPTTYSKPPVQQPTQVRAESAQAPSSLAYTGAPVGATAAVGAGLLAAGVAVHVVTRQKGEPSVEGTEQIH